MKHVVTVLSFSSLLLCSPVQAESDAERVFKQVSGSIVTVLSYDENQHADGQGSGIVIDDHLVVTNCHVIREATTIKVSKNSQDYSAEWLKADPSRDICLIQADGISAAKLKLRKLADVTVGESVFAIGNPLGFNLSVSSGLVSLITPQNNENVIVASVSLSPGSSGGGLFDQQGRLLGMTTAILSAGQNLNIVLPANWISELTQRGIAPPKAIVIPEPEPHWSEEAKALLYANKHAELEIHAKQWRALQPTSSVAALYLGLSLLNTQPDAALAALDDAIKLDENNEYAWRVKAYLLHKQGQNSAAEQALLKAQTLIPYDTNNDTLKAEWLIEEHKYQQAYTVIREALRIEPSMAHGWQLLGVIADNLGKADESTKAYKTALRLNPNDDSLKQALSQALARQGQGEAARVTLGNSQTTMTNQEAETWLALGNSDAKRKRYPDAEKAFRKAIEIIPDSAHAWLGLGTVLSSTNRNKEAELAYDKALSLKPNQALMLAELHTFRGSMREKLGDKISALADFNSAFQALPDYVLAWRSIGLLKISNREFKDAVEAYQHVVSSNAVEVNDWAMLGMSLEAIGDKSQALKALETAEKADPTNVYALQNLAGFHGRNGNVEKALSYIDRSLQIDSSDFNNWNNKGYSLLKLGRFPEAITALETASNLEPQASAVWINLGEAHMRNQALGKAIHALEKALTLAPQAIDARLYLSQCYLNTHQLDKAKTQIDSLLKSQPDQLQALGLLTMINLLANDNSAALATYQKIQAKNPQMAKELRHSVLAQKLPGAQILPE